MSSKRTLLPHGALSVWLLELSLTLRALSQQSDTHTHWLLTACASTDFNWHPTCLPCSATAPHLPCPAPACPSCLYEHRDAVWIKSLGNIWLALCNNNNRISASGSPKQMSHTHQLRVESLRLRFVPPTPLSLSAWPLSYAHTLRKGSQKVIIDKLCRGSPKQQQNNKMF